MLTVLIGLILASAFSAILVYAQELVPGRVGMISGLFFGFAFGMGGIGAAVLGTSPTARGIEFVYSICAYPAADRRARGIPPESRNPQGELMSAELKHHTLTVNGIRMHVAEQGTARWC